MQRNLYLIEYECNGNNLTILQRNNAMHNLLIKTNVMKNILFMNSFVTSDRRKLICFLFLGKNKISDTSNHTEDSTAKIIQIQDDPSTETSNISTALVY